MAKDKSKKNKVKAADEDEDLAPKKSKASGGRSIKIDGEMAKQMHEGGGGGSVRVPEDDYAAKIAKIERTQVKSGDNEGAPMLVIHYKITKGKYKNKIIKDRIAIIKPTMWKLRQLLEALGKKVPEKGFNVNLDNLEGGEVMITAVDGDPWRGKVKSEIGDVQSIELFDESDESDDDDKDDDDEDLDEVDVDEEL